MFTSSLAESDLIDGINANTTAPAAVPLAATAVIMSIVPLNQLDAKAEHTQRKSAKVSESKAIRHWAPRGTPDVDGCAEMLGSGEAGGVDSVSSVIATTYRTLAPGRSYANTSPDPVCALRVEVSRGTLPP